MKNSEAKFRLNVTDSETNEKYIGDFKCRTRLTQRQKMERGRLIRDFLGNYADSASVDDKTRAVALADLSICVIESPQWFSAANNGLDLDSDQVIQAIWLEIAKAQGRVKEEDAKEIEDNVKKLSKAVESGETTKDEE